MINFDFFIQASGIVFRESLEAVLIYGIIVGFFCRANANSASSPSSVAKNANPELRAAQWGLVFGILASMVLGAALVGVTPFISESTFSNLEIVIIFAGSLLMLYMVFWMQKHAKTLKKDFEDDLSRAVSVGSVWGTVFVAVFREGVETVVYLYSLSLQDKTVSHQASLILSLLTGVAGSFLVYRLILQGSRRLSMKVVFQITGFWLLFSSSALLATGFDKLFSAGFLERFSDPVYSLRLPEGLSSIGESLESLTGFRFQPSPLHLVTFVIFWLFVLSADPLGIRPQRRLASV